MQINNLRLGLLIFFLFVVQTITNNFTIFYIDCLEVALIILLLTGSYSLLTLVIISLFADLSSHWYLGAHLLGVVLISFFTNKLVSFFNLSSAATQFILIVFFYSVALGINTLIELSIASIRFNLIDYIFQIVVVIPIIMSLFRLVLDKRFMDIIN